VESSLTLRMVARWAPRRPLHASALGKALSANLPEHEMVGAGPEPADAAVYARTITDGAQLREQLRLVREQGYARTTKRSRRGVLLAAAVFGYFGDPLGGISISGPTNRMLDAAGRDGNVDHGGGARDF